MAIREVAWQHLKISEEESSAVLIDQTNPRSDALLPLCLAGKLLTSKKFNPTAMKATLTNAWNLVNEVAVREAGDNLFIFQFFNKEDRDHVLEKGPWCFDNQLLLLSEVSGDTSPSSITFPTAMFWVHVIDVPLGLRNDTTIKALGEKLGGYIQHDSDDPLLMGESIRIRTKINVSKPLLRCLAVQMGEKTCRIVVQYERLPVFCYHCGRLGHQHKDCTDKEAKERSKEHYQFGAWLHAPKGKRRLRPSKYEAEKEKAWVHTVQQKVTNMSDHAEDSVDRNHRNGAREVELVVGRDTVSNGAREVEPVVGLETASNGFLQSSIQVHSNKGPPEPTTLNSNNMDIENSVHENNTQEAQVNFSSPKDQKNDSVQLASQEIANPNSLQALNSIRPNQNRKHRKLKAPTPNQDLEMPSAQTAGSKRKAEEVGAFTSSSHKGSGSEKKYKGESVMTAVVNQVANTEGIRVREQQ